MGFDDEGVEMFDSWDFNFIGWKGYGGEWGFVSFFFVIGGEDVDFVLEGIEC